MYELGTKSVQNIENIEVVLGKNICQTPETNRK